MGIAPAVGLGMLVVFLVGAGITYFILHLVKRKNSTSQIQQFGYSQESWIEKHEEKLTIAGGILAVVALVLSFFILPRQWFNGVWIALTVIGVLFGISTFFIFGQGNNTAATRQPKPPPHSPTPPVLPHAPPAPPRTAPPSDNPYRDLLIKVRYDQALADRLIEYERKRNPNATVDELCRNAIWRLEHDNR